MSRVYLIPTPINTSNLDSIPKEVTEIIMSIDYYVVESLKTARRVLRKYGYTKEFDVETRFIEIDKHSQVQEMSEYRKWIAQDINIGIMSEAGLPCVEMCIRDSYWAIASTFKELDMISTPVLLINALNDSFLGESCYPYEIAAKSKYLYLDTPRYGGHVGFYSINDTYYHEAKALNFIDNV